MRLELLFCRQSWFSKGQRKAPVHRKRKHRSWTSSWLLRRIISAGKSGSYSTLSLPAIQTARVPQLVHVLSAQQLQSPYS